MALLWRTWEPVLKVPESEPALAAHFKGDKQARPKEWNQLWRAQNPWELLETPPQLWVRGRQSFKLYFTGGGITMRHIKSVNTPCVIVRIGPTPVSFYAFLGGEQIQLHHVGRYRSYWRWPTKLARDEHYPSCQITWV